MKYAVNIYSALTLLFVALLAVSGALAGVISEVVYFLAFLLPVFLGLLFHRELKRRREEERGLAEAEWRSLRLRAREAVDLAVLAPFVLGVVFLAAALTSLLLTSLGATDTPVVREHFLKMVAVHAVLPSLLEELLFRYLPIKLIAPYSRRLCIVLSSVYFALIHQSFFKMPYALLAGLIFISVDLAMDSLLPSVILHFLNNLLSLVWICYCESPVAQAWFVAVLAVAAVLSLVALLVFRRGRLHLYVESLSGESRAPQDVGRAPLLVIAVCLFSALLVLLG